jgi:hypothetical protein
VLTIATLQRDNKINSVSNAALPSGLQQLNLVRCDIFVLSDCRFDCRFDFRFLSLHSSRLLRVQRENRIASLDGCKFPADLKILGVVFARAACALSCFIAFCWALSKFLRD